MSNIESDIPETIPEILEEDPMEFYVGNVHARLRILFEVIFIMIFLIILETQSLRYFVIYLPALMILLKILQFEWVLDYAQINSISHFCIFLFADHFKLSEVGFFTL
ncbi:hypothetical protein SNEBB_004956 [Seison nebaliae]|nr:hypothetical protein SNEBB_004956 [Seison nebaliae]